MDGGVAPILPARDARRLFLGPDESLAGSVSATARDFEERTRDHWTEWARTLSIPFEWQDALIRSAMTRIHQDF